MADKKESADKLEDAANDDLWMFPHDGYDYSQHIRDIGGGTFFELV